MTLATGLAACDGSDSNQSGSNPGKDPKLASIATPAHRGLVKSPTADVRVRTSPDVKHFQAYLDNKPVTRRFGPARDGVRTARLPVARGEHTVYVRARSDDRTDFDRARFTAARRKPGAVAVTTGGEGPKMKLPEDASHVDARLNGEPVQDGAEESRDGLDADDGVRQGQNRLSVTAATPDGSYDTQTKTFSVPRDRPVAGAGRPADGQAGRPLALDATSSKPTATAKKLDYSWRVVKAPRGAKPKLEKAESARPRLRPDRNGRYTMELRVKERGGKKSARDTVQAFVAPKIDPIGWRLETIPAGGKGIQLNGKVPSVGGSSASGGNWVQFVVLDGKTLEVKVARGYNTGDAAALKQAVNTGVPQGHLAILTGAGNRVNLSGSQASVLRAAWKRFGGTLQNFGNVNQGFASGQWSIVGKPGLPEGAADQSFNLAAGETQVPPQQRQGRGGMSGLLEADRHNFYTFVYDQFVPIDTVVPNTPDNKSQIRVGSQTYTSDSVSGAGFHLLALDAGTLEKVFEGTFQTEDGNGSPKDGVGQLAERLRAFANKQAQVLVVLQSIGSPRPRENTWPKTLAPAVAGIGGVQDVFNNLDGKGDYALIGGGGLTGRYGVEQSQPMSGKPGRIAGLLSRNAQGQLRGTYVDSSGGLDLGVVSLAYGAPKPFPAWANADQQRAYVRVSELLKLKDPEDVRVNYWYDTSVDWDGKREDLSKIKLPDVNNGSEPPVDESDLDAVKSTLDKEFSSVDQIRTWIGHLQTIYTRSQTANQINVADESQRILSSLKASSGPSVATEIVGAISETLFVASYFVEPEAAPAIGAVAGAVGIAAELPTDVDKGDPVSAQLQVRAGDLGHELENRYLAASSGLDRLGDILVSDYGKLTVAGDKVQNVWAFDPTSDNDTGDSLRRGTRRTIYQALFPIAFHNDTLNPTDLNPNPKVANHYECTAQRSFKPYGSEPSGGQEYIQTDFKKGKRQSRLHAFGVVGQRPITTQILTNRPVKVQNTDFRVPSSGVTSPLFSTNDDDESALGFFKLEFFARYATPRGISCDEDGDD